MWENIPKDFAEYRYTAQILHIYFEKKPEYIIKFLNFAKRAKITLDPLFSGNRDSKNYTAGKTGYNEGQRNLVVLLLHKLIDQQFTKAKPQAKPSYDANIGAPGAGKTYLLTKKFAINVLEGKFAENAITVGPDLVVMDQIPDFVNACKLPLGPERTERMQEAYLLWRDASNFIANFMLCMAVTEHLNIVHDSTLTAEAVAAFLKAIAQPDFYDAEFHYNMRANLLLVDKTSRLQALEYRAKQKGGFASITLEDADKKGPALYARLVDDSYTAFQELKIYIRKPGYHNDNGEDVLIAALNEKANKIQLLPEREQYLSTVRSYAFSEKLNTEILEKTLNTIYAWNTPTITTKIKTKPRL